MAGNKAVVGVFSYIDDTVKAIKKVRSENLDYRVYAPFHNHELEEATLPGKSPVRRFTATGAVLGCTFGFALPILCSMDYPMRVSAKDVISVPAFFVIGYECTILFGAIFTLLAMLHFCRIPDIFRKVGWDPRFTDNKFGVVVSCDGRSVNSVTGYLKDSGAEEVDIRDAL